MKAAAALAAVVALGLAATAGADARTRHGIKHAGHPARHVRVRRPPARVMFGPPFLVGPGASPAYRYGGPLYSTCDRINADRMLVGTCR